MGFLPVFPLVVSKIIDNRLSKAWDVWIKEKPRISRGGEGRGGAVGEDFTLLCAMETRNKPFELLLAC